MTLVPPAKPGFPQLAYPSSLQGKGHRVYYDRPSLGAEHADVATDPEDYGHIGGDGLGVEGRDQLIEVDTSRTQCEKYDGDQRFHRATHDSLQSITTRLNYTRRPAMRPAPPSTR